MHAGDGKSCFGNLALAALFLGFSTLAGFPQMSLYMGLMLASFMVLDGILHFEWRPSKRPFRRFALLLGKRSAYVACVGALGALAAAALLLPAYQFGAYSARTTAFKLQMMLYGQDRQWFHLLKNLVVFPGDTWIIQGCRAAGIGSILAIILSIWHSKWRDAAVYIGMYLILCDCTLGPPFPVAFLLNAADSLNITASPWRAGIVAQFPLAVAVAFGVDAAARVPETHRGRIFRSVLLATAGAGMFLVAGLWLYQGALYWPWPLVWLIPALLLVAVCVLSWKSFPRLGPLLAAGLIACEVVAWDAQMLPVYMARRLSGNDFGETTGKFGQVREISRENRRQAGLRANWNMWTLEPIANGYVPLYVGITRQTLCAPSRERIYRVYTKENEVYAENHRGNLFLKRSFWLASQWAAGPLPGKDELFPSATTVFLPNTPEDAVLPVPEISRAALPNHAVSGNTRRIALAEEPAIARAITRLRDKQGSMQLTLPVAPLDNIHSVLCVEYAAQAGVDLLGACLDEAGVPHELKNIKASPAGNLLEFPLPDCASARILLRWPQGGNAALKIKQAYILQDLSDENAKIVIERRFANSAEISVNDLPAARLLMFTDSYYPGWRAYVDGKETPIMLADDAFKAIAVPAGTHRIRFEFASRWAYAGIGCSLAAWVAFSMVYVRWAGFRAPRSKKPAPNL